MFTNSPVRQFASSKHRSLVHCMEFILISHLPFWPNWHVLTSKKEMKKPRLGLWLLFHTIMFVSVFWFSKKSTRNHMRRTLTFNLLGLIFSFEYHFPAKFGCLLLLWYLLSRSVYSYYFLLTCPSSKVCKPTRMYT